MRTKHRKDYNHGKSGWVGGNPRYKRKRPQDHKNKTMKGLKQQ